MTTIFKPTWPGKPTCTGIKCTHKVTLSNESKTIITSNIATVHVSAIATYIFMFS